MTNNLVSTSTEVDSFLAELSGRTSASSGGRLIFALDATASRQPTWDTACKLQADMFRETGAIGGLSVQLVYYRGLTECRASRWISQPRQLTSLMEQILCRGGPTQIGKVLAHAKRETPILKISALVFVGDAMEENPDILIRDAAELGHLGVPAFVFQEGANRSVEQVFRQIASLSHGAYCRFDAGAAKQLGELLKAVALFAVGGVAALEGRNDAGSVRLIGQLK